MADSPLHRFPTGLLGAFDLQTLGDAPRFFGERVTPAVDVFDLYMKPQTGTRGVQANASVQVNGDDVVITVPQGEFWRLWSVGFSLFGPAALTAPDDLLATVWVNGAPAKQRTFTLPSAGLTSAVTYRVGVVSPRPWLLPPGDTIRGSLDSDISASIGAGLIVIRDAFPAN